MIAPTTQPPAPDPSTGTAILPWRWAQRRQWLAVLLAAIAARMVTFGNPLVHVDEQFYFTAARAMWDGAVPYVDVWDRKPVGLFLIYLLPARLGLPAGIYAYQLLALACLFATALIVMRLAERAGWRAGALFAGLAYVLWPNLLEGQGGQSPIFYNLLVAAAAMLLVAGDASRMRTAAPALLAIGIALQVKYSVVFEGIYFGLWCMAARWRRTRRPVSTLLFGAGIAALALLPTAVVGLAYALAGQFDVFWFANFVSITLRRSNSLADLAADLGSMALILSPLVAMAVLALRQGMTTALSTVQLFLFGWLFVALFGILIFGTWFLHYALPALVPAAICAAGIATRSAAGRRWAAIALLAAALGGQVLLVLKWRGRGGSDQFAALTREANRGSGCLFVYSGPPMLYAASARCRSTRFLFPTLLSRDREHGAIGVDQAVELRRILASRPGTIVARPAYEGERPEIHALLMKGLAQDYALRTRVPLGNEMISVFERRHPAQP